MKIHYINILLFELPLNILIYNQRNHKSTTHHTLKIPITRLLCECDLYMPNYDNDPQMKAVMENYNRQTSDRFKEYDERMKTTRQKCKDKCDKEIEKIILKDKLEKQMVEQLTTLETKIDTDDIPTCVCEKSIADKVEKACLKCTQNLGGIVAPSLGVLGGIAEGALSVWKPVALAAAKELAEKAGAAKGLAAGNAQGMEVVIYILKQLNIDKLVPGICEEISRTGHYANITNFTKKIIEGRNAMCGATAKLGDLTCRKINIGLGTLKSDGSAGLPDSTAIKAKVNFILNKAKLSADTQAAKVSSKITVDLTAEKTGEVNATYASFQTPIIASIVAIVVIILIMVIIYLILRYRRKKKMKKKLQYIKLLEE
ncbi:hypothetical protein PFBG_02737 [Plasmodium falciparum 7G8]|uniref:Rifin n=1 Tax=Plasmodium falciparum (isolate 7G8) TaxID=57266 RepID=W7F7Y0_PLAF8|nr:hypothetical protein PFBG_02737 [Plasmodium falciparum 7G8]